MKLILVRHGQTAWNSQRRIQGCRSDIDLSHHGQEQVARLAASLAKRDVNAIYSSPLKRAMDTAEAIARVCGPEVKVAPALREIDAGELEGLSVDTMSDRHQKFWSEWVKGNTSLPLPGGESLAELQARVWREIELIAARHPDETVIVVGHYFVILVAVCRAMEMDLSAMTRLKLDQTGVSILDISPQGNTLLLFNDTCHLDTAF